MKGVSSPWLMNALVLGGMFLGGCSTQDVPPRAKVLMTTSRSILSEALDTAQVIFTIDNPSTVDITVEVGFGGSALKGTDFDAATTATIPAGSLSGSLNVWTLQDQEVESNEEIVVSVTAVENGTIIGLVETTLLVEDDDGVAVLNLVLNEVLYDPSNNMLDGDANGDGVYVHAQDEFIELVNLSSMPADLSGFKVFDSENWALNIPNHTFPSGTVLASGKALVLFGGGAPAGTFGNALVQTSSSGDLNLNNAGDVLTVTDALGEVLITFDIEPLSNNPNEAYTRNPDLTGEFEQHSGINGALFSPGTKIDGTPF